MILIISEIGDNVTDSVMEYLPEFNVLRINQDDEIRRVTYNKSGYEIEFATKGILVLSAVKKVWYRRGYINRPAIAPFYANWKRSISANWLSVLTHLMESQASKTLGSFRLEHTQNKLLDLDLAKSVGFNVPETLVTTSKADVLAFIKTHGRIISKPLDSALSEVHNNIFGMGTVMIDSEVLQPLPELLPIALFQAYIFKEVELRIFYLEGELFTVAIFSQQSQKTVIDFRHYCELRPSRMVPFLLPVEIAQMVNQFMKLKMLNTGSLDFILTPAGEYVFLEVNPSGQFEWISIACNLNLEKRIADTLAKL
ncbi:MAG TPA: hypothetical protein VM802_21850 [Chitinophaga sp.]|uniref:hypothetical protein n=1 Tax=Chitinophaga sp. TaxID=1869181 RepID=UPI002BE1C3AB|nr:hypothetical protein [Chitinophaga sp.]HVI47530.1 hypothetical protein [Chitinophaga sp.]